MDHVFSTDPAIVIVEEERSGNYDDDPTYFFDVYLEGERVGRAYSKAEAKEIANEVFASVTGDPQEEEGF